VLIQIRHHDFEPIGRGFGVVVDHLSIRAAFYLGGAVGIVGTAIAVWYLVGVERSGGAVAVGADD